MRTLFSAVQLAGIVIILETAFACGGRTDPPPTRAARPNVLLMTIDTLRADRVGAISGKLDVTPAIDELARTGTTFTDATAHVPLTLPSHTSILTGRYPVSHGVFDNSGFRLRDEVPTLATVLHGTGYHTAAFVASFVLRPAAGLARGFDVYDAVREGERRAPDVARVAGEWLSSAPTPFFAWVHFYDPHAPYDPPPAFASKFRGRLYDGEVATADFGVSAVLDRVPATERANTMVIVTGDHGESLGEHGESEHGVLVYDSTLHVPLVMRGPGVPRGSVVHTQARHVDIAPTIFKVVDVQAPAGLDGVPLFPTPAAHPSYAESRFAAIHFGWSPLRSVRDGEWKYIDAPTPELYQLTNDPSESTNMQSTRAATAAGLAKVLATLSAHDTPSPSTMHADAAERLRSLGYVSSTISLGGAKDGSIDPKRDIGRYEAYVQTFNDGLSKLESGRAAEAEPVFRKLATQFPQAFEAHQYLARALTAMRRYRDALAELDVALALAPADASLYFDDAQTLALDGDLDRADAQLRAGEKLDPASSDASLTKQRLDQLRRPSR